MVFEKTESSGLILFNGKLCDKATLHEVCKEFLTEESLSKLWQDLDTHGYIHVTPVFVNNSKRLNDKLQLANKKIAAQLLTRRELAVTIRLKGGCSMATLNYPLYGMSLTGTLEDAKLTRTVNGINLPAGYAEGDSAATTVQTFGQRLFAASTYNYTSATITEKREVNADG